MEDMVGAMNYSCLDEMWSEEADFMSQLLVNCNSINHDHVDSESTSALWLREENAGLMYQSSCINQHHIFPAFPTDHALNMMTMDYCNHDDDDDEDVMNMQQDMSEESNKSFSQDHAAVYEKESKKRSRDIPVPRNRRGGVKLSKRAKVDDDDENINNVQNHMKSSSSCYSEDAAADSMNGFMSNSSCSRGRATPKTRAGRGSATDPQSLYARKRRERINERLKMLQKLVPNGTKVDISTMLEEAVQYVKFLQLQIKLLSSDDLWMYAPIAYNGMDIAALTSFQH